MKPRNPQLALRLDAAPSDAAGRWQAGAPLTYLGATIILKLDTACKEATLMAQELHLPLPPEAASRQVRDAAESWLRARAQQVIASQVTLAACRAGRPAPSVLLSFASRAGWVQIDPREGQACLRFHWRLIEQPQAVIAQVVAQAVARLPHRAANLDLFALA